MPDNASERDALVNRQLPEMKLSTNDNPLTAPKPPSESFNSAQRAHYRFSVEGNAIITGGAGTLALEAARALLEHGVSGIALWDINPSQSQPAIEAIKKDFPDRTIIAVSVDVRSADSIKEAMDTTIAQLTTITTLCCFAGVVGCTHAIDMTSEEWRRTHDINLTGTFLCAQAAARQMISQQTAGSIVMTASISAHATNFPQPQAAYNSSKAALLSLCKSLAAEWAVNGIRVNTISPGYMDTILNEGAGLERARNTWNERNPMGRMGVPWELTGPLVLLCGNGGKYINGTDLVVDGGAMVF